MVNLVTSSHEELPENLVWTKQELDYFAFDEIQFLRDTILRNLFDSILLEILKTAPKIWQNSERSLARLLQITDFRYGMHSLTYFVMVEMRKTSGWSYLSYTCFRVRQTDSFINDIEKRLTYENTVSLQLPFWKTSLVGLTRRISICRFPLKEFLARLSELYRALLSMALSLSVGLHKYDYFWNCGVRPYPIDWHIVDAIDVQSVF